jgi:arsenate reductase (thioredoxin)
VLFICEHGSAKSVVAVAHFNRLALQRGLDLHAISRGTSPDAAMHPAAVSGLAADGLAFTGDPILLSEVDLSDATKVVTFSELPPSYCLPTATPVWTVPPISEDYSAARDAIVSRIESLLDDLTQHS